MIYRGQLEKNVYEILEKTLESMGYEIVRIKILGTQKSKTMQIMIERMDGIDIAIRDCEAVNHQAIPSLAAQAIDISDYKIEISSPGLDRPLTRPKDFTNFIDHPIRVRTFRQINGTSSFNGTIKSFNPIENTVNITIKNPVVRDNLSIESVNIELNDINEAKLIVDDAKVFNRHQKKKQKRK